MSIIHVENLLTENDPLIGPPIVINMDKDVDRWNSICEHLLQWNIKPIRLPAVSGVKLPSLPSEMLECDASASLNLSHGAACRCSYYNKKQINLILEDDCRFIENPKYKILDILNLCNKSKIDWSVISLGCYSFEHQGKRNKINYDDLILTKNIKGWYPWGSHSYLVNNYYGLHIMGLISSCMAPVDHILLYEITRGKGLLVRPSISYQEEFESYRGGVCPTKLNADLHPDIIKKITQKC